MTKKKKAKISPRVKMPMQDPAKRGRNFTEVALGYEREMAVNEARRCLQCKKDTCRNGCPVEVDCKSFIRLVAEENFDQAFRVIKDTNSLPAICGRVCPQENQCEGTCKLRPTGHPIAIGRLERFVADNFYARNSCEQETGFLECVMPDDNLKVAAFGSGPSSLTLAGFLAARGVKVTIFEALHQPGGVLTYGIPEFRLPKSVVQREVESLEHLGVEFKCNFVGGMSITMEELFSQGCKAVFIGVGAGLPRFLSLPGENLVGVYSANEYLTRVNLMHGYKFPEYDTPVPKGKRVTVFGGGNVAMDAARTAYRLGASSVKVVYRRTKGEMPVRREELEHALDEGIELEILASPLSFHGDEAGSLQKVLLQKMELGEADQSGRRRPVPLKGQELELETDLAIIAVGTGANRVLTQTTPGLKLNKWGNIEVNPSTGETNMPMVFAGGDIVTGAATVVEAMGAGRTAAREILKRLK
ncbi:NADPH-dependent glutamate synthase [Desulfonatronovibrio hydrogenovorans]|uniref:NADPH-dependent glutamate synthase n=1 Tax=Desulfonatronovibrio hydrogenovorans TaxID=53245 RepID=UPI0004919223|nr:NADPH-dependent glutamate synthase [Desulfonatronovibrio hydrogenovorans]